MAAIFEFVVVCSPVLEGSFETLGIAGAFEPVPLIVWVTLPPRFQQSRCKCLSFSCWADLLC